MGLNDAEISDIIEAINDHAQDQLTPWEFDFMGSITEQWGNGRNLSPRQRQILDEIFERYLGSRR